MTLRELLEQNKDKFIDGKLKVRRKRWAASVDYFENAAEYFEIAGVGAIDAIGLYPDCTAAIYSLNADNDWELYVEPKAKKKLYPFLRTIAPGETDFASVVYCVSKDKAKNVWDGRYIGAHPTLPPIEIEVDDG